MADNNHQNKNNDSQLNENAHVPLTPNEDETERPGDQSHLNLDNQSKNPHESSKHDKVNENNSKQPVANQSNMTDEEGRHKHATTVEDTHMDQSRSETSFNEKQHSNSTNPVNNNDDDHTMDTDDITKDDLNQSSELSTDKTMEPDTYDDKNDQTDSQENTSVSDLNSPTGDDYQKETIPSIGHSNDENRAINISTSSENCNSNSDIQPNKGPEIDEQNQDSENDEPKQDSEINKTKEDTNRTEKAAPPRHPCCQFHVGIRWLNPQYHENDLIKKPAELENDMDEPSDPIDKTILNRVQGSIIGMALGDALGAHVEFRPHQYLVQHPVTKLESGGTWGLSKGQFTDDTSMALCLANSLIANRGYNPYDQLVRYKWWYKHGYMSSTGQCFDIGAATRQSVLEFEQRQKKYASSHKISLDQIDYLPYCEHEKEFDVYCSEEEVAGNGALMRLAPVPLFFYRYPKVAVEYSGQSGQITHGDQKAYDACRYYGALIVAAVRGYSKADLLDNEFYSKHKKWFGKNELHPDIKSIAEGSYKRKNGYDDGIRGKGYIVAALEAALWAFWSDKDSFENGALAAVNLGDDTDTTAAIYGQLAGACYGYRSIPQKWLNKLYAHELLVCIGKWLHFLGDQPHGARAEQKTISSMDNSLTQPKQIKVGHFSTNNPGPNYHNTIHLNSTQIPSYPQESRPPREQKYPGKQSYASHPAANPDNDVVRYGATKNSPSPYTSGNSQSEKYQLASKPSTSNQQLTHSSTAYATDRPLYVPDPYDLSRTSNLSQIQAPMNNNYPLTRPNPGSRFESGASSNLGQTRYNNSSGSRTHTNNTNRQFGSSDSTSRNSPKFDGTKSLPYSYDPRNGWS
ncbi:unnamed protein product [Adineta steineri]|uniref:ADP-ribosylglycohydrolase n=1 Tax=Adineta steineri TaxID=433720 RepID=A0A815HYX2_9BILA|nr:unnamed protein product [Adineta steineri]